MIACLNCGAQNREGSSVCRLCASPLASAVVREPKQMEEATDPVSTNAVTCPSCNAKNEAGWSFCQQCGKRLSEPQSSAPPAWKSPDELKTHESEQASGNPGDDQMFKTVATEAPETDPDFKPAQHLPSPAAAAPSSASGDSPTIIAKAPVTPPLAAPAAQTASPKPA